MKQSSRYLTLTGKPSPYTHVKTSVPIFPLLSWWDKTTGPVHVHSSGEFIGLLLSPACQSVQTRHDDTGGTSWSVRPLRLGPDGSCHLLLPHNSKVGALIRTNNRLITWRVIGDNDWICSCWGGGGRRMDVRVQLLYNWTSVNPTVAMQLSAQRLWSKQGGQWGKGEGKKRQGRTQTPFRTPRTI